MKLGFHGVAAPPPSRESELLRAGGYGGAATAFRGRPPLRAVGPQHRSPLAGFSRVEMTLGQACPPEYWRAQCAFKDSMVH